MLNIKIRCFVKSIALLDNKILNKINVNIWSST